jgi:hypothetical protein
VISGLPDIQFQRLTGRSSRMRMRSRYLPVSILALTLTICVFILAPRSEATSSPQDPPAAPPAGGGGQERPGRPDQSPEPRPYERVITKEAKSDEGVFTIHTIKDKVYYEIPEERTRPRVSMGEPDCQNHARRRVWRTGCRQSSREMGA